MLIAMPTDPDAAEIDWTIDQPAQSNRAEFTGKRRVTLLTAAPRWHAKVTLPPIVGEDRVLDWRAFVVDCDGIANSFRLVACEGEQVAEAAVRIDAASPDPLTLKTAGWSSAGLKLKRGHFVTVADQLLMVRAPVIADGDGRATISVKAYLRSQPVVGAPAEVRKPYAVMCMSDPKNGWKVGIGRNYSVSFDCEEAF